MIVKTSYMMSSFIISCEISYIMSMLYGKLTSFFHYDDGGVFFHMLHISGYLGLSPDSVIRFGQFSQIIYHYLFCSPKYPNILVPLSLQTPAICGVWRETADWED